MKHILFPDNTQKRLVYYLAAEEYVADVLGEGFFLWTSRPTVIFGRNQDMEAEVNVKYCQENSIEMYRRKSGGGCVYSDEGNLMLSCVFRNSDVESSFARYLSCLVEALRTLGLPAVSSSHNDVLVGDRKVSGNACFLKGASTIVHGTLIVDMDFGKLQNAITPSEAKLASHGVKSVRQRVSSLRELGVSADIATIKNIIADSFCSGVQMLETEDMKAIQTLELPYLDPEFVSSGILKNG